MYSISHHVTTDSYCWTKYRHKETADLVHVDGSGYHGNVWLHQRLGVSDVEFGQKFQLPFALASHGRQHCSTQSELWQ